jgi:outer membrane protein assembly factor BamB
MTTRNYTWVAALVVALQFMGKPSPAAEEWNQFLGPNRNGIASSATGLLETWPAGGPKEVWRVPSGVGMSGIAISGGSLCTLIQKSGQQWLVALDPLTGKQQWETALAPEYKNAQGDGPRATPTIVGERVFAYAGQGVLTCVNRTNGSQVWSHNVVGELGGKVADYGMACSPLVVGEFVIVSAGGPKGCLVAFRMQDGKQAWTAGTDPAGYSSPALLNVGGRSQLVAVTGTSAVGIAPDSGAILWRHAYETEYECNTANPIAVDGHVLLSSGENHGSVLLKLKARGEQFDVEEVWSSQGPQSVLRSEWQTPILLDGKLYGLDNIGSAGPVTHLTCLDAATGKRLWQQPRFGKANFIAADGKLFFITTGGEVVVVRATPKAYEEIGRKQVLGFTRQAPAFSDGRLCLRDDKEIVCLDVRK